ncbi:MAG TPA: chloride channel protein [Caulobacteraceae bacterium]|nr:chloride channel protein [Caulobacteraceae bacterium]
MRLLHLVQHLAWSYQSGGFLAAAARSSAVHRVGVVFAAGVLVGAGLWLLRFARGGHAGEITAAIWFHHGRTPVARTLGRAVLSIVTVGMGSALGREGALKHAGGLAGAEIAALARLTAPQRRLLTACGVGAGMAAAYNLPLGGPLFALEVLLGSISLPLAAPALACGALATAVSWAFLPIRPIYLTPAYAISGAELGWALAAGPIIGAFAALYVRVIAWADRRAPRSAAGRLAAPMAAFLALGAVSIVLPQLLGNGIDVVQRSFLDQAGPVWLTLSLAFARMAASAMCLGAGAPGGLFTPTMTCGALLGGGLGRLWTDVAPAAGTDPGACAVIGAGAMLAAATEGPMSAVVSVLELGQRIDLAIVPVAIAAAGAVIVARLLGSPSIYSARVRQGAAQAQLRRKDAPAPFAGFDPDYRSISSGARAAAAAEALLEGGDAPVYVVDEAGRLVGALSARKLAACKPAPLELMTANDLADPVATISAASSPQQAKAALRRSGAGEIGVTDGRGERLIGTLRR